MGELEAGVGQALFPLHGLGLPFRMLRALRHLIFMDTPDVLASPLLQELPASIVLHHLYSRAPASLPSPHVRHSFSAAQVWFLTVFLRMQFAILYEFLFLQQSISV